MAKSKDLTFGSECAASIGGTAMFAVSEGLRAEHTWSEPADIGMIGTDKPKNSGRQVIKTDVKGPLRLQPSYAHIYAILQEYFDESTLVFTPPDDPNIMVADLLIDRYVDIYTYAACWLGAMEVSWQENSPVEVLLDLLGVTETDAGASIDMSAVPDRMLASDLTVSMAASTYFPTGGRLKYSNDLEERFHQSINRSSVASRIPKLILELDFDVNSDTFTDLLALAGTDTTIDDVTLTFTNGSQSLTIAMAEMVVLNPSKWPEQDGTGPKQHTLQLMATLDAAESDIFDMTYVVS